MTEYLLLIKISKLNSFIKAIINADHITIWDQSQISIFLLSYSSNHMRLYDEFGIFNQKYYEFS
jgi:hypothetical protein